VLLADIITVCSWGGFAVAMLAFMVTPVDAAAVLNGTAADGGCWSISPAISPYSRPLTVAHALSPATFVHSSGSLVMCYCIVGLLVLCATSIAVHALVAANWINPKTQRRRGHVMTSNGRAMIVNNVPTAFGLLTSVGMHTFGHEPAPKKSPQPMRRVEPGSPQSSFSVWYLIDYPDLYHVATCPVLLRLCTDARVAFTDVRGALGMNLTRCCHCLPPSSAAWFRTSEDRMHAIVGFLKRPEGDGTSCPGPHIVTKLEWVQIRERLWNCLAFSTDGEIADDRVNIWIQRTRDAAAAIRNSTLDASAAPYGPGSPATAHAQNPQSSPTHTSPTSVAINFDRDLGSATSEAHAVSVPDTGASTSVSVAAQIFGNVTSTESAAQPVAVSSTVRPRVLRQHTPSPPPMPAHAGRASKKSAQRRRCPGNRCVRKNGYVHDRSRMILAFVAKALRNSTSILVASAQVVVFAVLYWQFVSCCAMTTPGPVLANSTVATALSAWEFPSRSVGGAAGLHSIPFDHDLDFSSDFVDSTVSHSRVLGGALFASSAAAPWHVAHWLGIAWVALELIFMISLAAVAALSASSAVNDVSSTSDADVGTAADDCVRAGWESLWRAAQRVHLALERPLAYSAVVYLYVVFCAAVGHAMGSSCACMGIRRNGSSMVSRRCPSDSSTHNFSFVTSPGDGGVGWLLCSRCSSKLGSLLRFAKICVGYKLPLPAPAPVVLPGFTTALSAVGHTVYADGMAKASCTFSIT
jgi:hypothetical protein